VALFAKTKPAYTVFRELRHSNQTMGGLKRYSEAPEPKAVVSIRQPKTGTANLTLRQS
jgi:hypothetical protein